MIPPREPQTLPVYVGYIILSIAIFFIGIYAIQLNHIYYTLHGPFFDSCAYLNTMAELINREHATGIIASLQGIKESTVILPWVTCSLLGKVLPLGREIAVWSQILILLIFALSLFYYYTAKRGFSVSLALSLSFPFLALDAYYRFNGGLSDFRMDLHLFILLATASVWYLITYHDRRLFPWIVFGAFVGLACLARATAPVYAAIMYGPLILLRVLLDSSRLKIFLGAVASAVSTALLAGWFYLSNFDYLHYYYVVWNADANAHLPLSQAIGHLKFAFLSIGWPVTGFAIIALLLSGFFLFSQDRTSKFLVAFFKEIDWKIFYIGLAPVLFLVFRGAGLNPFVCMPAAFGLTLFILRPSKALPTSLSLAYETLLITCSLGALFLAALGGISEHLGKSTDENPMQGHRQSIDTMLTDASQRGKAKFTFSATHLYYLQNESLWNSLIFDYGFRPAKAYLAKAGMVIQRSKRFQSAVLVDWKQIGGKGDDLKFKSLVKTAREKVDYLLIPDDRTIDFLETNISHNYMNLKVRELKKRLLATGEWEPTGTPIVNSSTETVLIYRNITR